MSCKTTDSFLALLTRISFHIVTIGQVSSLIREKSNRREDVVYLGAKLYCFVICGFGLRTNCDTVGRMGDFSLETHFVGQKITFDSQKSP